MKRKLFAVVTVLALAFVVVDVVAAGPQVLVEGEAVVFAGQAPVVVDGRTLVPVRGVFEELGFYVDWDEYTRTAVISNDVQEIILITIDSRVFTAFDHEFELDVPAQIIGGSTMVPIRLPLEAVGLFVVWSGTENAVLISNEPINIIEEEVNETMTVEDHFAENFVMVYEWLSTTRNVLEAAGEIEFANHWPDANVDSLNHTSFDGVQFDFWAGLDITSINIAMPVSVIMGFDYVTRTQLDDIFGANLFSMGPTSVLTDFTRVTFHFEGDEPGVFTRVQVWMDQ